MNLSSVRLVLALLWGCIAGYCFWSGQPTVYAGWLAAALAAYNIIRWAVFPARMPPKHEPRHRSTASHDRSHTDYNPDLDFHKGGHG